MIEQPYQAGDRHHDDQHQAEIQPLGQQQAQQRSQQHQRQQVIIRRQQRRIRRAAARNAAPRPQEPIIDDCDERGGNQRLLRRIGDGNGQSGNDSQLTAN